MGRTNHGWDVLAMSGVSRSRARAGFLAISFALAACAGTKPQPDCVLSSQKPMIVAELFFGRDIPGRAPLSDAEWSDFAEHVIGQQFPDGFTVTDGEGQWRDPKTQTMVHERTKILIVAAEPSPGIADRIEAITDAYKKRFDQESVGIVTAPACGTF
jgi:hypothetical protein